MKYLNSNYIKSYFILLIGLLNLGNIECVVNGCGTNMINASGYLDMTQTNYLVPCCNDHDSDYENPQMTKQDADDKFWSCLQRVCRSRAAQNNRNTCIVNSNVLSRTVKMFGFAAYNMAQKKSWWGR